MSNRRVKLKNIGEGSNGSLHPLIAILLESGLKFHSRNLRYDREGYPSPAWNADGEACSSFPAVCAKWITRKWKDESGVNCVEWYGRIDESIDCDCGSEEHNRKLEDVAKSLNDLVKIK